MIPIDQGGEGGTLHFPKNGNAPQNHDPLRPNGKVGRIFSREFIGLFDDFLCVTLGLCG